MQSRYGLWIALLASAVGCGRTSLVAGLVSAEGEDAGGDRTDVGPTDVGPRDVGPDSGRDGGPDSGRDVGPDGGPFCVGGCSMLDDACNVGVCDGNVCRRVTRPSGTGCDDGDPCSTGDRCEIGRCVGGAPLDCSRFNGPCAVGICDRARPGLCTRVAAPDGTACEDGAMCTVGDFCRQGTCFSGQQGSACSAAQPIPLIVGTQRLSQRVTCATDDVQTSCGMRSGNDVVWSLASDGPRVLRVETRVPGPGASMAFQGACGSTRSELACVTPVMQSLVTQTLMPGGLSFVAIDPGSGGFPGNTSDLLVTIDPHDVCGGALAVTLPPVGGTIESAGITVGAQDDFTGPCAGGTTSPDHVYQLTVNAVSRVRMTLEVPPNGASFDSAMYIFPAPCAHGPVMALACDDDANGNLQPLIETTLQPGVYFVVVDGFGQGNAGEYMLRIVNEPLSSSFVFPDVGDAILQQEVGRFYSQDGDFVEGVRRPMLPVARSAQIDLQANNFLMCDALELGISINGVAVGNATFFPGLPQLSLNLMFPPIAGPNYSIRYEVQRDLDPNCGSIDLPLGVSAFRLGP